MLADGWLVASDVIEHCLLRKITYLSWKVINFSVLGHDVGAYTAFSDRT